MAATNAQLDKRVTALEKRMGVVEAQLTSLKGQVNAIEMDITNLENGQAFLEGQGTDHEARITDLEKLQEPEQPPDPQPQPPTADCTVTQLADPPLTVRAEGVQQPDATFTWNTNGGSPAAATGRVVDITYPTAGTKTIGLTVVSPGGEASHNHTFELKAATTPPDPIPPVTGQHVYPDPAWKPDLVDVNCDKYADTAAMMAASIPESGESMFGRERPWIRSYEDDVSPQNGSGFELVVNPIVGVKACRAKYVPPGGCGSVSRVTRGVGWEPGRQRVFMARVQMYSPNWNAMDPACPPPGDHKNEGIDTVADMSGNFRMMACNSSNPQNPMGQAALNTPDPNYTDVYPSVARQTAPKGKRFAYCWDVKMSSAPNVADGHLWLGYWEEGVAGVKVLENKKGLKMNNGAGMAELLNKAFFGHNLDRAAKDPTGAPLWNDTFTWQVGTNRPAWAQLP